MESGIISIASQWLSTRWHQSVELVANRADRRNYGKHRESEGGCSTSMTMWSVGMALSVVTAVWEKGIDCIKYGCIVCVTSPRGVPAAVVRRVWVSWCVIGHHHLSNGNTNDNEVYCFRGIASKESCSLEFCLRNVQTILLLRFFHYKYLL